MAMLLDKDGCRAQRMSNAQVNPLPAVERRSTQRSPKSVQVLSEEFTVKTVAGARKEPEIVAGIRTNLAADGAIPVDVVGQWLWSLAGNHIALLVA
jgi:hypothetical protein